MMNNIYTYRPTHRTLAVIDGGLNVEASLRTVSMPPKPKLLDQVRQAIRARHYSPKTEQSYIHWIKRFIFFTANAIRPRWTKEKSRNFFQVSPANRE